MMTYYYALERVTEVKLSLEGVNSYFQSSVLVRETYEVIRGINNLISNCWEELKSIYRNYSRDRSNYIKYGGHCPSLEFPMKYKELIDNLKVTKETLLNYVNLITSRKKWFYDVGYYSFVQSLKKLLRV